MTKSFLSRTLSRWQNQSFKIISLPSWNLPTARPRQITWFSWDLLSKINQSEFCGRWRPQKWKNRGLCSRRSLVPSPPVPHFSPVSLLPSPFPVFACYAGYKSMDIFAYQYISFYLFGLKMKTYQKLIRSWNVQLTFYAREYSFFKVPYLETLRSSLRRSCELKMATCLAKVVGKL